MARPWTPHSVEGACLWTHDLASDLENINGYSERQRLLKFAKGVLGLLSQHFNHAGNEKSLSLTI